MRDLYTKNCEVCGVEFKCKTEKRKHCSAKCYCVSKPTNRTYHILNCELCGNEFKSIDKMRKFCSVLCSNRFNNKNRPIVKKVCIMCGSEYDVKSTLYKQSKYCSDKCREKDRCRNITEERKLYIKKYLIKNSLKYKKRYKEINDKKRFIGRSTQIVYIDCVECGKLFIKRKLPNNTSFCSHNCNSKYLNKEKTKLNRNDRKCIVCGNKFNKEYGQSVSRSCCSEECNEEYNNELRRRARRTRRMREKVQFKEIVIPKRVYVRDGFKCGICGYQLDMGKSVPDPLSPTIDHILPLSLGGEHSYNNVRAAHFICNSLRSNKMTENDMLLVSVSG